VIDREAPVLLNITEGGRRRQQLVAARSSLELDGKEVTFDETPERVAALFG
jgi:hypothetical protein